MSGSQVPCYRFNDFFLDIKNCQLLKDNLPVSLTQKSFDILRFLVENNGRILKKEEFLESLWQGSYVEEANLTQHIYMLRKALKQNKADRIYIETIPKNGYRFIATVEEISRDAISENGNGFKLNDSPKSGKASRNRKISHEMSAPVAPKTIKGGRKIRTLQYALLISLLTVLSVFSVLGYFYFGSSITSANSANLHNKSLAVLPFRQIDKEKDAKLGIGIADVLIARLANIEEIAVRPTTSILRFSDMDNSDLFDVGNQLGVDWVIEGTVQREGDMVRVTTRLYDVAEKRSVWTVKFDEEYSDIFSLQDKVSEKIAKRLSSGLKIDVASLTYKQYTNNSEAYKAYSLGLSFWNMHTSVGFENAIKQFSEAVKIDPNFVMAYAYLADAYGHTEHIMHLFSVKEALAKAEKAAKKALELDQNSAEAMASLALTYSNTNRQAKAFDLMRKSLEIKPNDAHSRHRISWMYANRGEMNKAVEEAKIARAMDPRSAYLNLFLGEMLILARRPDEAVIFLDKTLEIEPGSFMARWRIVETLEHRGLLDEAEDKLLKLQDRMGKSNKSVRLALSRIYAKTKRKDAARKILNKILSDGKTEPLDSLIALTYIALGEEDLAVTRLKGTINQTQDNLYRIKYEPNIDPIRSNQIFAKLLKDRETVLGW